MAGLSPARKKALLEALRAGSTSLAAAAREVGVSTSSVSQARTADAEFKMRSDRLVALNRGEDVDEEAFPDFLSWRERFMGYYLPDGRIVRASNYSFHSQGYHAIEENNRLIMLVPPMHMKTSIWSIEFSTYLIMRNRRTRITVIQKSQDEAKKIIRAVQQRLTDHTFYEGLGIAREDDPITLYGGKSGFKGEKYGGAGNWSADSFTVVGTDWGEKDPTMQAKGASSAILGNRAEYIILDDIQDPRFSGGQEVTNLLNWVQLGVLTRLGPDSKLVVLGSRIGPGDIYERMLAEDWAEDWPVIRFPAVLDWDSKERLLPDLWSWDKLMQKRKEVGHAWHTAYMQEEGDRDDAVFTRPRMEAARSLEHRIGHVPDEVTDIFIGVDPAIVNWNVILVWGLNRRNGMRYLLEVVRKRGLRTEDAIVALLGSVCDRYLDRLSRVTIETNNVQASIYEKARSTLSPRGIRVTDYKTVTGVGARAHDLDFTISSIAQLYADELVVLPYGDGPSRTVVDAYTDELVRWRTTEDGTSIKQLIRDQVMANLFAESGAFELMRQPRHVPNKDPRKLRRFAHNGGGGWPWSRTRPRQAAVNE